MSNKSNISIPLSYFSIFQDIVSREEYQIKKQMEGLGKNRTSTQNEVEKTEKDSKAGINEYMPKYIVQAPCKRVIFDLCINKNRVFESKRRKFGTSESSTRKTKSWH